MSSEHTVVEGIVARITSLPSAGWMRVMIVLEGYEHIFVANVALTSFLGEDTHIASVLLLAKEGDRLKIAHYPNAHLGAPQVRTIASVSLTCSGLEKENPRTEPLCYS